VIPVEQQQFAEYDENGDAIKHGDCMRACVASLFELPLEEVPHFVEHDNWYQLWSDWLAERNLRWSRAFYSVRDDDPTQLNGYPGDIYWLATVKSPRIKSRCNVCKGTALASHSWTGPDSSYVEHDPPIICPYCDRGRSPGSHLVVMFGKEIAWDPHPQREMGHLGFTEGWDFRLIDPARAKAMSETGSSQRSKG
jgi:hypothetical protein